MPITRDPRPTDFFSFAEGAGFGTLGSPPAGFAGSVGGLLDVGNLITGGLTVALEALDLPFHQNLFDVFRGTPDLFASGGTPPFSQPDINVQGPNIFTEVGGSIVDAIVRQVTSAEGRAGREGIFGEQLGDVGKILGNIDLGLEVLGQVAGVGPVGQAALSLAAPAARTLLAPSTTRSSMATNLTACPVPIRSNVPAGSCVTIGDWVDAGSPRGFEVLGVSGGDTVILRKRSRRRSRRPLPPSLVAQFAQLKDQLGPAMAKTIINRMRF